MTNDRQAIDELRVKLTRMKADTLDLRIVLDRLTAQGNQLADAYNKRCVDIMALAQDIDEAEQRLAKLDKLNEGEERMSTTINCLNEACRYLSKSDICGLIDITVDRAGLCKSQEPHPPAPLNAPLDGPSSGTPQAHSPIKPTEHSPP